MKFRSNWNGPQRPVSSETSHKYVSQTVPGLSLTVLELMKRHTSGLGMMIGVNVKTPIFDGDDEDQLVDLSTMDKADRMQYIQETKEEYKNLLDKIRQAKKEREEHDKRIKSEQDMLKRVEAELHKRTIAERKFRNSERNSNDDAAPIS